MTSDILANFYLQEIKKRLSLLKLEKEELESTMTEVKKESKEIENKNKVSFFLI